MEDKDLFMLVKAMAAEDLVLQITQVSAAIVFHWQVSVPKGLIHMTNTT